MAREWLLPDPMGGIDIRRLIARLAVAIMAADGRITTAELGSLRRLDDLGLGPLGDIAREEIERAAREPIDVAATCTSLPALTHEAADLLLGALAELAACDRHLADREREVFHLVAGHLGLDAAAAARMLEDALTAARAFEDVLPARAGGASEAAPCASADGAQEAVAPLRRALRVLGLEPGAARSRIDAAFLDRVQRYDPAKVGELGPEFAALAVRRLAVITDAYEVAIAGVR
jgi:uncharacterized tellurite resistance protein B-like protein